MSDFVDYKELSGTPQLVDAALYPMVYLLILTMRGQLVLEGETDE